MLTPCHGGMLQKHPGSTGTNEKQSGKPPLPNNTIAELRKGSYYASLELVQSLCDTSYGLVDIFPVEDRKIALREVGQIHYFAPIWLLHFMALNHFINFSTTSHSNFNATFFYVAVPHRDQFSDCFC